MCELGPVDVPGLVLEPDDGLGPELAGPDNIAGVLAG